ncbi:MAG: FlaD/FlaE family flagellar protein [Halobacteriota archaeon]
MGLGTSLLITLPTISGGGSSGIELLLLGPAAMGAFGIVGASILERILDSDSSDGGGSDGGGGDALMDDAGGGGFGDMDEGFDDFDDMGGFGDGDDPFDDGGGGGGGGDVEEIEHQLEELENEVASLSSTVTTVRSENTEISERVEDIEEDVRNLLDIYEMVTRGINPFVDEAGGDFDLGGDGSLGLFDDGEDESEEPEDEVDESIMSADAEGFFDEELAEDDADDDFGDDNESEEMVSDQTESGGKTFSELKEEYDSGEAEWAEDEMDDEFEDDLDDGFDDDLDDEFADDGFEDDGFDDGLGDDDFGESLDDGFDDDGFDDKFEEDTQPGVTDTAEESLSPIETDTQAGDTTGAGSFQYVQSDQLSESGEKPYLTALPGDYVGDLVVMEWLEFLVGESTVTDAARAVNYYERIEWIGPDVAEQLRSFLSGFGDIDRNKVDRPGTDHLQRNHHIKSLKYIMQLNGTTATSVILDRWDSLSGQQHGGL